MEHMETPGPDDASRVCKSALYSECLAERDQDPLPQMDRKRESWLRHWIWKPRSTAPRAARRISLDGFSG
jgi:hypothetical protein